MCFGVGIFACHSINQMAKAINVYLAEQRFKEFNRLVQQRDLAQAGFRFAVHHVGGHDDYTRTRQQEAIALMDKMVYQKLTQAITNTSYCQQDAPEYFECGKSNIRERVNQRKAEITRKYPSIKTRIDGEFSDFMNDFKKIVDRCEATALPQKCTVTGVTYLYQKYSQHFTPGV